MQAAEGTRDAAGGGAGAPVHLWLIEVDLFISISLELHFSAGLLSPFMCVPGQEPHFALICNPPFFSFFLLNAPVSTRWLDAMRSPRRRRSKARHLGRHMARGHARPP